MKSNEETLEPLRRLVDSLNLPEAEPGKLTLIGHESSIFVWDTDKLVAKLRSTNEANSIDCANLLEQTANACAKESRAVLVCAQNDDGDMIIGQVCWIATNSKGGSA